MDGGKTMTKFGDEEGFDKLYKMTAVQPSLT